MSLTFMAMDLCIWYYDLLQSADGLPTCKEREVVTGTVTRKGPKFYCGSAEIQTLRDGDEIEIRRTRPHSHPYPIYDETTRETRMIDSFLTFSDYKVLSSKKDSTGSTSK